MTEPGLSNNKKRQTTDEKYSNSSRICNEALSADREFSEAAVGNRQQHYLRQTA